MRRRAEIEKELARIADQMVWARGKEWMSFVWPEGC